MGFSLAKDDRIKVVVSKDASITCTKKQYQEYLKDLDEKKLKLNGSPTRFVLRKGFDFDQHAKLLNARTKVVRKGRKAEIKTDVSSMLEEVRLALIAVENPKDMPEEEQILFKRDSDGNCHKDLIANLRNAGVFDDIYSALNPDLDDDEEDEEELSKKN